MAHSPTEPGGSDLLSEWLDRAYACIADSDGLRFEHFEPLESCFHSGLPQEWYGSGERLRATFTALNLDLQHQVIPYAERTTPGIVGLLHDLGRRLDDLTEAVLRPGSTADVDGQKYEQMAQEMEDRAAGLVRIHAIAKVFHAKVWSRIPCPACQIANDIADNPKQELDEDFGDPLQLRSHFAEHHPRPDYRTPMVDAVRNCFIAYKEINASLDSAINPNQPEPVPTTPSNSFRKEGKCWVVVFGGKTGRFSDLKGLAYYHELISNPWQPIAATVLEHLVGGVAPTDSIGDLDGLNVAGRLTPDRSPEAAAAATEGFRKIQDEIDMAELKGDADTADAGEKELAALRSELSRAYDIRWHERDSSAPEEKARQAVDAAIRRARNQVSETLPSLGDHLEKYVKGCCYSPPSDIDWET